MEGIRLKNVLLFSPIHTLRTQELTIFLCSKPRMVKCDIGVRDISDHTGVYLTLHLDNRLKETLWRLNTNLLSDPQCQRFIKEELM